MTFNQKDLQQLLRLVDLTSAQEIDCDEFLERVAVYLERLGPDGQPPAGSEDVVQHLRVCPECLEEFEVLYQALRDQA